ncbi:MAG: methyltransferase domain-containing protein [Candidatus Sericytochromatia bacterium]
MSFIDLKRRRSRRVAELVGPATESFAPPPAPEPPPEPVSLAAPVEREAIAAPEVRAAYADDADLRALTLDMVQRLQEVLVVGLGPWDHPAWAEGLRQQARGITVVDPDKQRLQGLRPYGMTGVVSTFDQPGWTGRLNGQRFDVILIGSALTHLPDPTAFLRQARDLLAPGGTIVAIIPNVSFGERRLNLLKGEYPRAFGPGSPLHHYTRARARELFAFAGFSIVGVHAHEQPLFAAGSELVPELFPEALLQAVGSEDDLHAAHFVVKAQPASAESLLRELFDEQEHLRKAVRNELAKAARTHDALSYRLEEADDQIETLATELGEAKRQVEGLEDLAARAEHNMRRLSKEADEALEELSTIKESFWFKLLSRLGRIKEPNPVLKAMPSAGWRHDETLRA